jgi:dsRNA-specific ribonuclease
LLLKRGNQINYELVNLLINKGADTSIKNKLGQSAHDLQNIKYSSTGALLAQEKIKDEYASQMQNFLSMAKLPASEFEYITDYSTLQQFRVAFTLKGVQSIKNYEEYEWIGDGIIHGILSQYIPIKYIEKKNLRGTNEGYFGNLRTAYETNEYMEQILKHYNLAKFIIKPHVNLNIDHKVYADVFEAIIGLFVELVDKRMGRGYGYMYAFNLLENIFDAFPPKIITFINTLPQGTTPKEQISMGKEMMSKSVSDSQTLRSPKKAPVFTRLPMTKTPALTPISAPTPTLAKSRPYKRYTPRNSGSK